jgi:prophage regulatory protein
MNSAEQVEHALALLAIARCPNEDCVAGAYHDNRGEPCQCQWCAERARLTAISAKDTAAPQHPRLLKLEAVKERSGYSTSGLYLAMERGEFPRPLKRGAQSVWVEAEVDKAVALQISTLPRMGPSMGANRQGEKKAA